MVECVALSNSRGTGGRISKNKVWILLQGPIAYKLGKVSHCLGMFYF